MKCSELSYLFEETEYEKEQKQKVINAINEVDTIEAFGKLYSHGYFNLPDGSKYLDSFHAEDFFNRYPDVLHLISDKFLEMIKTDDDAALFVKNSFYAPFFDEVLNRKKEFFIDFFVKIFKVVDGDLIFDHPLIKDFGKSRKIQKILIAHDHKIFIDALEKILSSIPDISITFNFGNKSSGFGFLHGRDIIFLLPKDNNVIQKLSRAIVIAQNLDDILAEEHFKQTVLNSSVYRKFSRNLSKCLRQLLVITEADVYTSDYAAFLHPYQMSEFFERLSILVQLLPNARVQGHSIFHWFYSLPQHGAMHKQKSDFLEMYSKVLSSTLSKFVDLESVFDDDQQISNFSGFD